MKINRSCLALFSRLYKISTLVYAYKTVIIIATSFSIAAQLLYLKQLIYHHYYY
jgi:hypothetical protein